MACSRSESDAVSGRGQRDELRHEGDGNSRSCGHDISVRRNGFAVHRDIRVADIHGI